MQGRDLCIANLGVLRRIGTLVEIKVVVQVPLLKKRHDLNGPANVLANCFASNGAIGIDHSGRQILHTELVMMHRKAELRQVIGARRSTCCFACCLDGRKEQPDKHADNCDHDEQFHKGETAM